MNDPPPHASDEELAAALLVLEQEGPAALTLDHVARRLGRGQRGGASSLPWPDGRLLRSDLGALGFRRLRAAIAESVAEAVDRGAGPAERLLAAGRAYVRTAVRSPQLFTMMHARAGAAGADRPTRARDGVDLGHPDLARESAAAFAQLRSLVESVRATGYQAHRDVDEIAHLIWTSVQRLAARWADAALDGPVDADTIVEAIDLEMTLLLGDAPKPTDAGAAPESPGS